MSEPGALGVFTPLLRERQELAIRSILQVTLLFEKMELDTTDRRIRKAFRGYIECENELKGLEDDLVTSEKMDPFVVSLACFLVTCYHPFSVSLYGESSFLSMALVPQQTVYLEILSIPILSGTGDLKKAVFHPWNTYYQVRDISMYSPAFDSSNPEPSYL